MDYQYAPTYVLVAKDWVTAIGLTVLGYLAMVIGGIGLLVAFPDLYETIAFTAGSSAALFTIAGIYVMSTDRDRSYVDVPNVSLTAIGWGVVVGIALVLIQGGFTLLLLEFGLGEPFGRLANIIRNEGIGVLIGMILVSFLVTAPAEELFFRNIIQKKLYNVHSAPLAVVGASVLFTLTHIPDLLMQGQLEVVTGVVEILINALIYGGVYAYFRRIDVTIVAHGLYNSSVFLLAFFV